MNGPKINFESKTFQNRSGSTRNQSRIQDPPESTRIRPKPTQNPSSPRIGPNQPKTNPKSMIYQNQSESCQHRSRIQDPQESARSRPKSDSESKFPQNRSGSTQNQSRIQDPRCTNHAMHSVNACLQGEFYPALQESAIVVEHFSTRNSTSHFRCQAVERITMQHALVHVKLLQCCITDAHHARHAAYVPMLMLGQPIGYACVRHNVDACLASFT